MSCAEYIDIIQRSINNGQYEEAVDAINIVCSQPGVSLPESLVPQLFPSLTNAEEGYLKKCCKALEKLLQFTSVNTIICQMEVQLKQGFEHPSPLVKALCLRQLHRAVQDRRNLKMVGEAGVMKYAITLLADEELSVVKECNRILVTLAGYDEGILILFSDQGVKLMKEVMSYSDTIRYRVFDVIIDSILISDQALESANSASFTAKILEDLESPDILLQLTALENVSRLSDSPTAYTTLRNMGIFKGIGTWLASSSSGTNSDASYTVPSVIKLFAKLAQKHNIDLNAFCADCPRYVPAVCGLVNANDFSIRLACIDVITLLNSRVDGKQVLLAQPSHVIMPALQAIARDASRGTDDVKDRCLVALAQTFSLPEVYIPDFETHTEEWFRGCQGAALTRETLKLLSHPDPVRQCAAASLLRNFAMHRYGIEAIVGAPGWTERLLDRSYCVDREAQTQRFALVIAFRQSAFIQELVDRDTQNKITKFVNEGAHYRGGETAPSAVLEL